MSEKTLTKLEQRDLHALAKAINDRETTIRQLRGKTEDFAGQTITEAMLQGRDLIKARASIPHGDWMNWLAVQCPLLNDRMARRYIQVASNWTRVQNAGSLRAALLICEETGAEDSTAPAKKTPADLQALYLFSRASKYVSQHPLGKCPTEVLDAMRERLEPVVRTLWPERFA